jgi:hypothetical protein
VPGIAFLADMRRARLSSPMSARASSASTAPTRTPGGRNFAARKPCARGCQRYRCRLTGSAADVWRVTSVRSGALNLVPDRYPGR